MPTVLLLGGSHNGRRIQVNRYIECVRLQKVTSYEATGFSRFLLGPDLRNIEEYHLQLLKDEVGSSHFVYAVKGTNIIDALLKGYTGHGY